MNYAEHIRALCAQHGIEHRHVSILERSCSWGDQRAIATPHVRDELCYFVALHEIGHVVREHEGNYGFINRRTLQKEGQAWQWAFDNALHEPSPAVAKQGLSYLLSYWHARNSSIKRSPSEYAYARNYLASASRTSRAKRRHEQLALAV